MPCRGTNKGEHTRLGPQPAQNGQLGIYLALINCTHQINKERTNIHTGNGGVL